MNTENLPHTVDDILRALVRTGLRNAGISQAEACRRLDVSEKHLSHMLTGRAKLSLEWASRILAISGYRLSLSVVPAESREE